MQKCEATGRCWNISMGVAKQVAPEMIPKTQCTWCSIQMLQQILASIHYVHPSFVKKLNNNNNRHARFSELVDTIPKHDVMFSDKCAITQNLWSRNVYFWSNKNQISTQNWNTICLALWYGHQYKQCILLVHYVPKGWANWHTYPTMLRPML